MEGIAIDWRWIAQRGDKERTAEHRGRWRDRSDVLSRRSTAQQCLEEVGVKGRALKDCEEVTSDSEAFSHHIDDKDWSRPTALSYAILVHVMDSLRYTKVQQRLIQKTIKESQPCRCLLIRIGLATRATLPHAV